ncbi:MAG: T9SS type A sorting domain-containing protein [Ginsengibacter sp.]
MNHNDLKRTGWNSKEIILAQDNVSSGNFGKIFSRDVDDQIYTQPLVVSNVSIGGGIHNIVLVATVNNSLYAFDADDPSTNSPFWQSNLTYDSLNYRPIRNTDMTGACAGNYKDFSGKMGIVGTPAIDTATKILYVVSRSVTKDEPQIYVQYLHAIDILTGEEKPGSPVYITATYPGNGIGSVNGTITFEQQKQLQRTSLLLFDGVVYICWASHCDWLPYQGWIIGYDAATFQQKYVYNAAPEGGLAGIWMSGQAPSVDDDGNIYVTTGNGTTGANGNPNDTTNRGSSLIKLSVESGALKVVDFFTPMNYQYINDYDWDYGVTGVLLVPGTHISLSGSKDGGLYVIDNNNMGGTTMDNSNVIQRLNMDVSHQTNTRHLYGSPVYFKDEYNKEYIYGWAGYSYLKQIPFVRSTMKFDTLNTITGNTIISGWMPGAMLSLSSEGSKQGTGILWASHAKNGSAGWTTVSGMLQAFDATDVTRELWNSNWNAKRDSTGMFAKFVPPTIANGKVYMASFSGKLNVYGLNPPPASVCVNTLPPMWQSADIGNVAYAGDVCVGNGVFSITASGRDIGATVDAFHYVYQPVITNYTELTIRIDSIKNTDPNAKSGIMFRQNMDPGSPFVFLNFQKSHELEFLQRLSQGVYPAKIKSIINSESQCWMRILNYGNKYISYTSPNGDDWIPIDSVTFAIGPASYVGIAYTTKNNSVLDTAIVSNVTLTLGGVLSSNITNFNARNVGDKYSFLNWTESGINGYAHYEIERSTVTTDFKKIESVPASTISQVTNNYTFKDIAPENGTNFYRIKLISNDGSVAYSPVVKVNFNFRKIEIFPNPAKKQIFVRNNKNFSEGKKINIQLLDFDGKVLYRKNVATTGVDIIPINISPTISNGMYLVMVTNSKGEQQGETIFINR